MIICDYQRFTPTPSPRLAPRGIPDNEISIIKVKRTEILFPICNNLTSSMSYASNETYITYIYYTNDTCIRSRYTLHSTLQCDLNHLVH